MNPDSVRDHLFISYATEDWALAEWLTLKLTALGYRTWCDRFQLLGGESANRQQHWARDRHEHWATLQPG